MFNRNETHTGLCKCNEGLQRLDEKVENLAGYAKSLVNDVFKCAIKFYVRVIIYGIVAKNLEESYLFLRDQGHIPPMCPGAFKILTIALAMWEGKKALPITCGTNSKNKQNSKSCHLGLQMRERAGPQVDDAGNANSSCAGHQKLSPLHIAYLGRAGG